MSPSRKRFLWLAVVLVVVATPFLFIQARNMRAAAELEEQLRLARAEGIPTNSAEYAALIEPARPEENAARYYRQLKGLYKTANGTKQAIDAIRTTGSTKAAAKILDEQRSALDVLDKASALPRCWFDRDWSQGAAVLFPEFADMKYGARLLILRGWVRAAQGDAKGAIRDVDRAFAIAKHLGEEPTGIANLVRDTVYVSALRGLADWSFKYRDPAYALALDKASGDIPPPNLKRELAEQLYSALSLIDLMKTKEGRAKIGLREGQASGLESVAPILFNQRDAKTNMVKAYRRYWAALDDPKKNQEELESAASDFMQAMIAYPTAADVYTKLGAGYESERDYALSRMDNYLARQQQYTALVRVLKMPSIPRTIRTDDLKSPYNGGPLQYRYDGKQITIKISGAPDPFDELILGG
ncbi:MAG: hypothetical protein ACAH95_17250 [Fimbriimonas sp.]